MSKPITVAWDRAKFQMLVEAHADAKAASLDSFEITIKPEGTLKFVTNYAGYLIEYLKADFAAPDIPTQPNKEGEEGQ